MVVVSSTFSQPVEGILLQTPSTKLFVNDQELGTATLYITESNVVWGGGVRPSGVAAPAISLLYPSISLHAVQRDPSPALYMVLNYELRIPELAQPATGGGDTNEDDDDEFDADDQPITQLRFVPQSEGDLQAMYSAMSQGQALHPDPTDEVDEDDPYMDGEEFDECEEQFEDAMDSSGAPAGSEEEAAARLRHLHLDRTNGTHPADEEEDADISDQ
ncbi:methylosome subunit pICln isoform X1 [Galleria mellonella]|uniref:Methylosome subunit pICln n=1 Tax=Galleria mellonella TaxID=7137 RepID=A0ABM3MA48_GALME|nr:methylosome subunit pICln isoform X1 [Galleria mellonella]